MLKEDLVMFRKFTLIQKKSIKLLKWRPKYNNLKLILKSAFKWKKIKKKS